MKIVEESKNHYVLQAPNGAKVRVAKNGLSGTTAQKIQAMAKGGKVEYAVSSENTLNPDATEAFKKALSGQKEEAPKPKDPPKKVAQYADGGVVEEDDGSTDTEASPNKPVDIHIDLGGAQAQQQHDPKAMFSALETAFQKGQESAATHAQPQGQVVPAVMTQPAVDVARAPAGTGLNSRNALAGAPTQGKNAPDMFQQIKAMQGQPGQAGVQAINEYVGGQKAGLKEIADQDRELKQVYEKGYGESSDFVQKINDHQARYEQVSQELGALSNQIKNNEIKPKTMFSGGNFLQNIGTALSVLAGGVSQGLTGAKSNPVMDYINNQIDLDLQRQKHEYGKLENQYTILRQTGMNEAEAINLLKAQQLQTVNTMLHMNEQRTKNLHTKLELQKAGAAIALQTDAAAKQAATEQTLRANLQQQTGQPSQSSMMNISANDTDLREKKRIESVGAHFENIAKSIPYLVKDAKLVPKVLEEVQRVRSVHEQADDIMKSFDAAAKARGNAGNFIPWRENAEISALRQLSIPLIKTKEGTPREFEAHALEKLFPALGDSKERIDIKREGWKKFIQEGSTSSLLDSQQVPYPKLKLGGKKFE